MVMKRIVVLLQEQDHKAIQNCVLYFTVLARVTVDLLFLSENLLLLLMYRISVRITQIDISERSWRDSQISRDDLTQFQDLVLLRDSVVVDIRIKNHPHE